eukprot:SAG31_NODE_289_length_18388_cov_7.110504_12_plen_453_part_00
MARTGEVFAAGVHIRAGKGEHVISLGDGSFVGFPTPCGDGRGCGNPLCTMSCIRRISKTELLHWAGNTFEINGGKLVPGHLRPGGLDSAARAVHLLGRDGNLLFADDPARLVMWCVQVGAGSLALPSWIVPGAMVEATADLAWLQNAGLLDNEGNLPPANASTGSRCPISGAIPRQPYTPYICDGESYEPRLLLRWLQDSGTSLHPGSGLPLNNRHTVMLELRASINSISADGGTADGDSHTAEQRGQLFWMLSVFVPAILSQLLLTDHPSVAEALTAYATCVPAVSAFKLPFHRRWRMWVEGEVHVPLWMHRATGVIEATIVLLRMLARDSHSAVIVMTDADSNELSEFDAESCSTAAHLLTCAIVGFSCAIRPLLRDPGGTLPTALLLVASFGSQGSGLLHWKGDEADRQLVLLASIVSLVTGCLLACSRHSRCQRSSSSIFGDNNFKCK